MDLTAHEKNNFLAFRSSCDRCRYMKLKCPSNGSEAHDPCERCSKAKLHCTYSRRTNLKKRPASGQDQESDTQDNHDGLKAAPADVAIDEPGSDHCDISPNSLGVQNSGIACEPVEAFRYSNTLDVVPDELLWADWDVPSSTTTASSLWQNPTSTFLEHRRASISAQSALTLVSMAVELGECLQSLRSDSQSQEHIQNYPIGKIHHLSQMFANAAQNRSILPGTDIAMSLLLLSCYASLRKLYINVFSNIKSNLPSDEDLPQNNSTHNSRSVRLRGMEVLNEKWMRSYTVFNLTLDSLRSSDAAANLCAVYRPPDQSSLLNPLAAAELNRQCMTTGNDPGVGVERPAFTNTCVACALPESVRKEAISILNDIVEQEHELHRIIIVVRGTLRQQIGFS